MNIIKQKFISYKMSVPTALIAQLYFHAVDLMSREAERVKLNFGRRTMISTMADLAVQLVSKASDAYKKFYLLVSMRVVTQPYLWSQTAITQYQVFS